MKIKIYKKKRRLKVIDFGASNNWNSQLPKSLLQLNIWHIAGPVLLLLPLSSVWVCLVCQLSSCQASGWTARPCSLCQHPSCQGPAGQGTGSRRAGSGRTRWTPHREIFKLRKNRWTANWYWKDEIRVWTSNTILIPNLLQCNTWVLIEMQNI